MSNSKKIIEIIKEVKSGIVKISFYKNDVLINSGSGFLVNEKLISNSHVFYDESKNFFGDDVIVGIRFGDTPVSMDDDLKFNYKEFMKNLKIGSERDSYDYAVFTVDGINYNDKYQFKLSDHNNIEEGGEILVIGYPFDLKNISSHAGHVSSIYKDKKVDINIIQIDASVNNGNSGGPLINIETGEVVGIVTRKQTGLAKQFDQLISSFDDNVKELSKVSAVMSLGGVNIIEFFKITQKQMQEIAQNIKRSANTGIGYAFSCEKLKKEDL